MDETFLSEGGELLKSNLLEKIELAADIRGWLMLTPLMLGFIFMFHKVLYV